MTTPRVGRAPVLAVILAGVTAACDSGPRPVEEPAGSTLARDSAGLEVLEHREALQTPFWTVEPEPALELGSGEVEGVPPFFRIRGAVIPRTVAGEEVGIVVADGGSRELRVFSMAGELTSVLGGPGEGPGEFRSLDEVVLIPPDTILAFDAGLDRMSRFHVEEGFVGSFRLAPLSPDALGDGRVLGQAARFLGRAADGSLFVEPLEMIQEPVEGLWSAEWLVARLEGDGTNPSIVGRFFQGEQFVAREGPQASVIARPFGRRGAVRVTRSELLAIDGSFPGYHRHSLAGEPLGVVRTTHERQAVTSQERDRWRAERIGDGLDPTEPRQRLRLQAITEVPFPEAHPAVDRMLPDPCGFVWLRTVLSAPEEGDRREWLVFRLRDHQWMGSVRVPHAESPIHIGEHHLLSIVTTDLGEEFVRVSGIDRDPAWCDAPGTEEVSR